MTQYIIYFNQTWVGEHSPAWFASRGPLAKAVVEIAEACGWPQEIRRAYLMERYDVP